jgi:hypothetical protein
MSDEFKITESNPRQLGPSELRLADTIKLFDGPFGWGIVKKITKDEVHIFRPYGTTLDFSCTSGVICLIGTEEVRYPIDSRTLFKVYGRKELK